MSSSPMKAPKLHDNLVLLDGGKRWPVPGASTVRVTLAANNDDQPLPAEGNEVTQLHEATAEVDVSVQIWTSAQWDQYQHLLAHLRRGRKEGPAVFTSAHPEIAGRKVKRLYFVSETGGEYRPNSTYKASLKFSEKLKEKDKAQALGDNGQIVIPGSPGATGVTTATSASGQAVMRAVAASMPPNPPQPADGGRATTATPGYCSASIRVIGTAAGMNPKLFGASANATAANFQSAGLAKRWGPDTQGSLQQGDMVFWQNDPSGFGHVGVVVGKDTDGMPLIYGNNLVTYKQKGGTFDAAGRPINTSIDARGTVRLDQLSTPKSQPTLVGRPGGWGAVTPPRQGPPVPIPTYLPSQNIRPPGR